MRVRGKGSTRKDGTKGDLLVTIEVQVPQRVDGQAKDALEQFAAAVTHLAVECMRRGRADAARYVADPRRVSVPTAALLSEAVVSARRATMRRW